jgi:hypothetical protein
VHGELRSVPGGRGGPTGATTARTRSGLTLPADLDAGTVFLWSLSPGALARWLLPALLAVAAGLPLLLLWLLGLLARWSSPVAALAAGALLLYGSGRYLRGRIRWLLERHDPRSGASALAGPTGLLLALAGWLHLMGSEAVGLRSGFDGAGAAGHDLSDWLLLAVGKTADLVLFDLSEALGWKLGPLEPASPRAALATAVLQLLLAVGLLEVTARLWRMLAGTERFYGTFGECRARCADHLDIEARVTLEGVVCTDGPVLEVDSADFQAVFAGDAKREEHELRPRDEREEL